MSKPVKASYDAEHNTLRLVEPLEGVQDREEVDVIVTKPDDPTRPWLALKGTLPEENAEELSRLINEMFPPWNE
jgi:hypothetical protein